MAKPATQPALAAQAGQAVIWNVLFLPARLVAEIGVQLIQLNVLSLAAFGVLTIIRAGVNLLGTWIDLGIERALPRFIPEVQRNNGRAGVRWFLARVMAVKLAVLALVGLALWLLSDTFLAYLETQVRGVAKLSDVEREQLLGQIERNGWFWIMAIVMLLALGAIYDVLMAYLISYFRQRAWNSVSLINMLAQPLLISAVVLLGWDVTGVVVAMLLTAALGVVLAVWQVLRVARTQPAVEDAPLDATGLLRRFVPYSALSYLFNLSDMAASYVFLVFFVQGLEQAALLSVAANIARQVLGYLYVPMQGVQVPLFTRARAGDGATLPGAYAAACRLLLLLLVPGGVGLIILAQPLVLAQFPRFVAAVPAIMLLTPFLFAESLLATSQNALMVSEQYPPIIVSRLLAFSSLPLAFLLAPPYGVLGAVLAIGLARVLAGAVVFVAGERRLALRFPGAYCLRLLLAAGIMAAALLPLAAQLPTMVSSIAERVWLFVGAMGLVLLGAVVFVAALRMLGGLDPRDRQQLAGLRLPLKRLVLRVL